MEARISDRLRSVSSLRHNFVEYIQKSMSQRTIQLFSHPFVCHFSLITTTLCIIISVYAKTKSVTLFSFHPVLMTIGSILFVGEGIIAFRNKILLETLSPIMQHNKITKVRAIHQTCQILGSSFMFLGLMFVFANKVEFDHSIIPKSLHSILGSIVMVPIIAQIVSGDQKLNNYFRSNVTIRRWHGDAGLLLWDFMSIIVIFGLYEFHGIHMALIFDSFLVLLSWFLIQIQLLRGSLTSDNDNETREDTNLIEPKSSNAESITADDEFIP